jgi:hypothetical protein
MRCSLDLRWTVNSAAWTIVPIKIIDELLMSALGQKQTSEGPSMSALPLKADIAGRQLDVRFVPEADISDPVNGYDL